MMDNNNIQISLYGQPERYDEKETNPELGMIYYDKKALENGELKPLSLFHPSVELSDIGYYSWKNAIQYDKNAKLIFKSFEKFYRWEILIITNKMKISLHYSDYLSHIGGASPDQCYVIIILNGERKQIKEFLINILDEMERNPWEMNDWNKFSLKTGISRDAVINSWIEILGDLPDGKQIKLQREIEKLINTDMEMDSNSSTDRDSTYKQITSRIYAINRLIEIADEGNTEKIVQAGAIQKLIELLDDHRSPEDYRPDYQVLVDVILKGVLLSPVALAKGKPPSVRVHAAEALCKLIAAGKGDEVMQAGLDLKIVAYLKEIYPGIVFFRNLAKYGNIDSIVNSGALDIWIKLLNDKKINLNMVVESLEHIVNRKPEVLLKYLPELEKHRKTKYLAKRINTIAISVDNKICPTCGIPIRYIKQYERWWCDNCKRYI